MELALTSRKKVTLTNVLHVPKMNKNLMSGDLLCKARIKFVYESRKLILSRNDVFSGKGYSTEGMVKLLVVTNDQLNVINKNVSFAYVVDSVSLWHNRLAHISINTMKRMTKCNLISSNINEFKRCEFCVK